LWLTLVIANFNQKEAKMGEQLHKRFSSQEVIEILERYLSKEIGVKEGLALLKIKRRRFFDLLKEYQKEPGNFSVEYQRKKVTHQLDELTDKKIVKELAKEKQLIEDKRNPIRHYNYSYVHHLLVEKHDLDVSLSTVIRRAKKMGFIRRRNIGRSMIGRC
jgi:hypothetical protein